LKRIKQYLFIVLTMYCFLPVWAQTYSPRQIELAEQLHLLAKNAPPELAYIQTSKDIYETGEDLWFKVYLLESQYLMPSLLSKTLYLQLLNENTKKPVWEEKYEIQNDFANGRVYLESTLPEGNYFLAAYTPNSFFNDTTEFKAIRKIIVKKDITSPPLVTAISDKSLLIKPVQEKANSIQFTTFPEGGDLVTGIRSKLAFKAVNKSGEPVDIEGTLFEANTPLQEFKSSHAGMGSFDFTPDANKKYHIRLTQPAIDSTFLLPEIAAEGMTLKLVDRNKESLSFKISQSPGLKTNDFYIRVQCRGVVYGMTAGKVAREILMKIPLSLLPQGIAELTLFNNNLVPVAERLVYINQDRKLNITTWYTKEVYPTRGKVSLKITAKDEDGYPVVANLGVSVFDKLYQNPRDSSNILSHIYLSSQLKGRIYNPSFYFNSSSKGRDEALDLLMLTQGWRKYVWSETNLKGFGETREQVIFDGIKGKLFYPDRKKKIPKEQTFVMAFSPNKDSLNVVIPTDSTGGFIASTDLLKRWENDYVYLKPFAPYESQRSKKTWDPLAPPEFNFHIRLKDPFETINHLMRNTEISYPIPCLFMEKEDSINRYSVDADVVRIKEVTIKKQKAKTIRGKYLGVLDSLVMTKVDDDYVCQYNVLNCPRHNRNELGTIRPTQGKQYLVMYDYNTPIERTRIITYWRPKYSEDELLKINNLSRVKAYYGNREFYQPNYDQETGEEMIPDFRNTLLWEPSVITNENGEATLSFFCSDINTEFVGRIEGVSDDGLLGTGSFKFTVRKVKFAPK
jgi:hypothetical protein